jgi:hypothetical protein
MEAMMGRRKKVDINDPFIRETSFVTEEGKTVTQGDLIKIKGIWGTKFRFHQYVTNPKISRSWIDCIELEKGVGCGVRSFYPDRVKVMPKKRGKRVKRNRSSQTP